TLIGRLARADLHLLPLDLPALATGLRLGRADRDLLWPRSLALRQRETEDAVMELGAAGVDVHWRGQGDGARHTPVRLLAVRGSLPLALLVRFLAFRFDLHHVVLHGHLGVLGPDPRQRGFDAVLLVGLIDVDWHLELVSPGRQRPAKARIEHAVHHFAHRARVAEGIPALEAKLVLPCACNSHFFLSPARVLLSTTRGMRDGDSVHDLRHLLPRGAAKPVPPGHP